MARQIKDELNLDVDLRTGPTGRFDVFVDDERIASREQVGVVGHVLGTGTFPEGPAVIGEIRKRMQPGS
jgi:hypothetical protein